MSTGADLHVRETVFEDEHIYIEDFVETEDNEPLVLRQVFFASNPSVV